MTPLVSAGLIFQIYLVGEAISLPLFEELIFSGGKTPTEKCINADNTYFPKYKKHIDKANILRYNIYTNKKASYRITSTIALHKSVRALLYNRITDARGTL